MPTQVQQPPPEVHHDPHSKHANALHRDALLQALGSILAPKRPTLNTRSSSASTVDSSRSSSGTASPAHGHPALPHHLGLHHSPAPPPPPPHSTPTPSALHHPHSPSPLGLAHSESPVDAVDAAQDAPASPTDGAQASAPIPITPAARAKFIDSLKSKNGAWDALIHGSFS
ncbi:hypothetical protein C8R44DRAFT_755759 [Mycena epipterygia]|nr:hypothetical protein C8R44DRAFT_755759 [Mycena epipterygia]